MSTFLEESQPSRQKQEYAWVHDHFTTIKQLTLIINDALELCCEYGPYICMILVSNNYIVVMSIVAYNML